MKIENDNPIDTEISDLYRTTQTDEPSAALDAAILAQAEAATKSKAKRPAWIAPVGLAATVLIGVNLAMNLKDYSSEPAIYSESSAVPIAKQSTEAADTSLAEDPVSANTQPALDSTNDVQTTIEEIVVTGESSRLGEFSSQEPEAIVRESTSAAISTTTSPNGEQPEQRQSSQMLDATSDLSTSNTGAGFLSEQDTFENQSAKPVSRQPEEVTGSRIALEPAPQVDARVERQIAIQETARQAPRPSRDNIIIGNSEDKSVSPQAAIVAPVIGNTRSQDTSTPAADSAPAPVPQAVVQEESEEIQEVIVTGTQRANTNANPHRRPTAKAQSIRNRSQINNNFYEDDKAAAEASTAQPGTASNETYICDLEALKIDQNAVEQAKVDARTFEPPLSAATWPGYILELAESRDYATACAQLAAYQQLFPDLALIAPLPVVLLPQKTDN